MEDNLKVAEYRCRRRPTHEEIELARKRVADPNILTGRDKLYAIFKMAGIDVEYDEIFADWEFLLITCFSILPHKTLHIFPFTILFNNY